MIFILTLNFKAGALEGSTTAGLVLEVKCGFGAAVGLARWCTVGSQRKIRDVHGARAGSGAKEVEASLFGHEQCGHGLGLQGGGVAQSGGGGSGLQGSDVVDLVDVVELLGGSLRSVHGCGMVREGRRGMTSRVP
jgi:hypothetical protein